MREGRLKKVRWPLEVLVSDDDDYADESGEAGEGT